MATVNSAQIANDVSSTTRRNYPIDDHGKLRIQYFYYINATGGTLADGTEIDLCDLPPGRVRILPNLCRIRATAMSTSRVLDLGHRIYYDKSVPFDDAGEAEDDDAFISDKDISSAVNDAAWDGGAAKMKFDIWSRGGVRLFATVDGGTIPSNGVVEGFCIYVVE